MFSIFRSMYKGPCYARSALRKVRMSADDQTHTPNLSYTSALSTCTSYLCINVYESSTTLLLASSRSTRYKFSRQHASSTTATTTMWLTLLNNSNNNNVANIARTLEWHSLRNKKEFWIESGNSLGTLWDPVWNLDIHQNTNVQFLHKQRNGWFA